MDVSIPKFKQKPACRSEYDALQTVILYQPEHMAIKDIINETQKYFEHENIDVNLAKKQHSDFQHIKRTSY